MKIALYRYMVFFFLFFSYGIHAETNKDSIAVQLSSANNSQQGILVGEIEKEDLLEPPFAGWFNSGYESYTPAPEAMEVIKNNISEFDEIIIFMGTWCPDSRREVPKMFKILELTDYDLENLKMFGVDTSKETPDNAQETYNIKRVPTFIFFKDGKEVGRFVEYPRESFEKDIAKIVSGQEYRHSYEN